MLLDVSNVVGIINVYSFFITSEDITRKPGQNTKFRKIEKMEERFLVVVEWFI